MIQQALAIQFFVNMDSSLQKTREYWRRMFGLPEHIVVDPRKLHEITDAGRKALEESK